MFEDDAAEAPPEALGKLVDVVKRVDQLQERIDAEAALYESLQKQMNHLRMTELPEAMEAAKVLTWTTDSGRVITRKQIISGTWPKEEQPLKDALAWLKKENLEDLLKVNIAVAFDKGAKAHALEVFEKLRGLSNQFKSLELKETVHPQTLNAALAERLEKGLETPLEMFNGFTSWIATITEPGGKKRKK